MKIERFLFRCLIAAFLLVIHYVVLFIPLSEIILIYIIFFNPKWIWDYLDGTS